MKLTKRTYLVCLLGLMTIGGLQAQQGELSAKQQERENNKVEMFTPKEKDNIQRWFYEQTNAMKLTDEVRSEYSSTLVYYVYDMKRLNDKDQELSKKEILDKFYKLVERANLEVKPMLTEAQYKLHLEYFGKIANDAVVRFKKQE